MRHILVPGVIGLLNRGHVRTYLASGPRSPCDRLPVSVTIVASCSHHRRQSRLRPHLSGRRPAAPDTAARPKAPDDADWIPAALPLAVETARKPQYLSGREQCGLNLVDTANLRICRTRTVRWSPEWFSLLCSQLLPICAAPQTVEMCRFCCRSRLLSAANSDSPAMGQRGLAMIGRLKREQGQLVLPR